MGNGANDWGQLSAHDAAVLDFEDSWDRTSSPKDQAIMERFGCSSAAYYQRLNLLLDDPAALSYKPVLVKRLLRLRSQRQVARGSELLR
ncbi:DUF3263 domain-containing protein [Tessaracoccus sp. OH4464_COT-324]|uniref:DUF3263 domain-containing protein n=1 Tax=Tessaracoccus sp. OH4464_COT-324 TaxID=2491059 RepID=UPI0018F70DA5|nr:DUF3263 domain-containing protein [Tessaracoccus sp. OH4464_COT-324]